MSERCLVTGGAGFIGSHVADELVRSGYTVTVLDDLSGGIYDNVPRAADYIEGSILDHELLCRLFLSEKFDYVFHFAAYAAEGLSPFIRRFNYTNNLIGSVNLINESIKHKVKRFVFTSSIAAQEEVDPYGIAKRSIEKDLQCAYSQFGLEYSIIRPHNVYGERQNLGDRYRNVVGIMMNQARQGKPLTIFGDGEQTRCFTYISDVAIPIAQCISVPMIQSPMNIGSESKVSINQLAKLIQYHFGNTGLRYLPERHEVKHAIPDNRLHRLSWPTIELTEGLCRMARWAKTQDPQSTKPFHNIEITQGLPDAWLDHHGI